MRIAEVQITDKDYVLFAKQFGSVFNSPAWLSIYGGGLKVYGIFDKGDTLIGIFNLYFDRVKGFSHLKNPPYSPTISLVFKNPSSNIAKKHSFDKSIYKLIVDFVNGLGKTINTFTLPTTCNDMQPFIWNKYKVIPNYTYRFNLAGLTADEVFAKFSPERRNDIKKAVKDEVECKLTHDYSIVKEMVQHTFDRKEKSLNGDLIDQILSKFANESNSFSFVSYLNSKPIAASFIIYDQHMAYYLLGGYDPSNKHQGAGALAVQNAINHTLGLGIPVFDFEGSMLPEVEKYFRAFGGEMKTMYTINKAKLPIEMALKLIDRSRF